MSCFTLVVFNTPKIKSNDYMKWIELLFYVRLFEKEAEEKRETQTHRQSNTHTDRQTNRQTQPNLWVDANFWPKIGRFTLLHLHEIVKGYIFNVVCLCVYVCLYVYLSVCVPVRTALLVNKIPAERMHRFEHGLAKGLLTRLAQTLLKLVTLGQRSRSQWLNTHFIFIILC